MLPMQWRHIVDDRHDSVCHKRLEPDRLSLDPTQGNGGVAPCINVFNGNVELFGDCS